VRALLRRTAAGARDRPLEFGALLIDPERREALREGAKLELTTLEFDLLWFLASRPGRVFSREQLMEQVWGNDRVVGDRSIDSLVSRLRKKIELDAEDPQLLQTVWGAGYRFADAMSPAACSGRSPACSSSWSRWQPRRRSRSARRAAAITTELSARPGFDRALRRRRPDRRAVGRRRREIMRALHENRVPGNTLLLVFLGNDGGSFPSGRSLLG
jgi:DNA-binding winged helix-turn-helix (wHTH) protein